MTITVIIPAYNAAKWLPLSVPSVLAQTRPADEIIIVDDGSSDNTAEVARTFESSRVKLLRRENGGLSAARNTGIAASTGEWILSLDADDTLYPHALACLEKAATNSRAGVVYGLAIQRRAQATETRLHSLPYAVGEPPAPAKANFWWTSIATAGSALIRRSLNTQVGGFDEHFRQVEDSEYWLRCGVTTPFEHCGEVVIDKTYVPSSLGQQQESSIWYRLQLQLKFLLWCEHRKIDTAFLETSHAGIVDHALTRIYRQKAWPVLGPVLAQAERLGVQTPWVWRATLRRSLMKSLGTLPPDSPRCVEVYRNWLNDSPSQ